MLTYIAHSPALGRPPVDTLVDDISGSGCNFLQACTSVGFTSDESGLDDAATIGCR